MAASTSSLVVDVSPLSHMLRLEAQSMSIRPDVVIYAGRTKPSKAQAKHFTTTAIEIMGLIAMNASNFSCS